MHVKQIGRHWAYGILDRLLLQRKYGSEFDSLIKAAREAKRLKEEDAKAKSISTPTPEQSKCECMNHTYRYSA
jgi:hypothetical protein